MPIDESVPWPKRFLKNPKTWLTVALLALYAICLIQIYREVVPDREVPGGTLLGLGKEVIPKAAKLAAYSLIPLTLLFMLTDRFRPQRFWVWLMALGWGGCVATYLSLLLNTAAASQLSVAGDGDPASAARAAIYVAPFVEEVTKGTVLFWIAILMRYQFVSRVSGVVLAMLAGAGFAFTENIIYYGRAYRFAAQTFGQANPDDVMRNLFFLRGVMTPYGHPLFTFVTGLGVAIGVRHKSKVVRICAPLAGFMGAAFLHMAFNTTASLVQGPMLKVMWAVSLVIVASLVIMVIRMILAEGVQIRQRLSDYARAGWLQPGDPAVFSRLRTRLRCLWQALWSGPRVFWATTMLQRSVTELAYLRDAMSRGLVDDVGYGRERELFAAINRYRVRGIDAPLARAPYPRLPRLGRAKTQPAIAGQAWPAPVVHNPAWPAPGQVPAGVGSAPLGSTGTQYSAVDPSWKPPS